MTVPLLPDPATYMNGITATAGTFKTGIVDPTNAAINAYNASTVDPGWSTLSLISGFTGSASYKIVGSRFYLDGTIVRTAGAFSTTATTVATLPSAGVPLRQQQRLIAGAVSASTVGAVEMLVAAGATALQLMQGPGTAGTVWLGGIYWDIS